MGEQRFYNISEAALEVSLSPHTIRAWEKRYGALTPLRATNGNRLYTEEDMIRLRLLVGLVNLGSSISQVVHLTTEELRTITERFRQKTQKLFEKKTDFDPSSLKAELPLACRNFDLKKVSSILEQLSKTVEVKAYALEILPSVLAASQDLAPAQASAVIALLRFHAGQLLHRTMATIKQGPLFVLTGYDSNNQEMSLLQMALLFAHAKKSLLYLNSHLPTEALNEALKTTGSRHMVISFKGKPPQDLPFGLREGTEVWFVGEGVVPGSARHFTTLSELDHFLQTK